MTDDDKLIARFRRDVTVHDSYYSIREALQEMSDRDYSQVVVRVGGHLRLLTLEGIGRAMADSWNNDYIDIKHAGIEDYVDEENMGQDYGAIVVMGGERTVSDARAVLMQFKAPRVAAIVLTDSGDEAGQPIGIVTPWDLSDDSDARASTQGRQRYGV